MPEPRPTRLRPRSRLRRLRPAEPRAPRPRLRPRGRRPHAGGATSAATHDTNASRATHATATAHPVRVTPPRISANSAQPRSRKTDRVRFGTCEPAGTHRLIAGAPPRSQGRGGPRRRRPGPRRRARLGQQTRRRGAGPDQVGHPQVPGPRRRPQRRRPSAASSIPAIDARRWTFRFTRPGNAVFSCVRLRLPHSVHRVSLVVGTVFEPVFELPPGFTQDIAVRCEHGQVPIGWGLERRTDDNGLPSSAPSRPSTAGSSRSGTPPRSGPPAPAIRCLEKKQRAPTGQHHAFSTRVASFTERVDGGLTASRACASNEYGVATGVSPAGDLLLTGTTLTGTRDAEWSFSSATGSTSVQTSLICLARTTGFHR